MATGLFSGAQPTPNSNGTPNYWAGTDFQNQYNQWLTGQNNSIANPNQYTPGGSKTTTQNPDGTWSTNTKYSPQVQQQYDNYNNINLQLQKKLMAQTGQGVDYSGAPAAYDLDYSNLGDMPELSYNGLTNAPQYDTSTLKALADPNQENLNATRDNLYKQQTQYLDPQYQRAESDLTAQLANQGIMPGSEAYNRARDELAMKKQRDYDNARMSAIQAGGAEQSRMFDLGLKTRQQGVGEALNSFNTGMQGRQQGVSERNNMFNSDMQMRQQGQGESDKMFNAALALRQQGVNEANTRHNSGLNDLTAMKNLNTFNAPQFQGYSPVTAGGVDWVSAMNNGYLADLAKSNADKAGSTNTTNGILSLLNSGLQNPGSVKGLMSGLSGLFSGGNDYADWLGNNSGWLSNSGLSVDDLLGAF